MQSSHLPSLAMKLVSCSKQKSGEWKLSTNVDSTFSSELSLANSKIDGDGFCATCNFNLSKIKINCTNHSVDFSAGFLPVFNCEINYRIHHTVQKKKLKWFSHTKKRLMLYDRWYFIYVTDDGKKSSFDTCNENQNGTQNAAHTYSYNKLITAFDRINSMLPI